MKIKQAFSLPPSLFAHLAVKKVRRTVRRGWVCRRGPRPTRPFPEVVSCLGEVEITLRRRFPIAQANPTTFSRRYVEIFGEEALSRLVERAERFQKGEFDLLGSGPYTFNNLPDWHCDFKSGYRWRPDLYHADVRHMEPLDVPSDYKVPWELSRCHHLLTLGEAFFVTRDERFAETVRLHVDDWIRKNPYEFGINWVCAMDVAVRAVNWLWAYALLLDSEALDREFRALWLTSLVEHGRYILANDEWGPLVNNHYLANGAGLLYLGLLLSPLRDASRFLRRGLHILTTQTLEQLTPDGCNREGTLPYHKLILELTSVPLWLAQRNGFDLPPEVWTRLEQGYAFLWGMMNEEGNISNVGDADDGRLHPLSEVAPLSVRPLVNAGVYLFHRPEWAGPVDGRARQEWEEVFWLSGGEFLPPSCAGKRPSSLAFSEGGYYALRSSRWEVFVDAAPIGLRDTGGHGHNDPLSFELDVEGEKFIVDSGAYVYKPDPVARNRFRSVRAHNTLEIDDQEPSLLCEAPHLWTIEQPYHLWVREWRVSKDEVLLDAEHDGYRRLGRPVIHRRRFRLNLRAETLVIEDILTGEGEHCWTWRLHIAPSVQPDVEENVALLRGLRNAIRVLCPSRVEVMRSEMSPSYGVCVPTYCLVCRGKFAESGRIETQIERAQEE